jgi:hypothetical protein
MRQGGDGLGGGKDEFGDRVKPVNVRGVMGRAILGGIVRCAERRLSLIRAVV